MNAFFVVVAQAPDGMVIQSRHKTMEAATKERDRMAKLSRVAIYGALRLALSLHHDRAAGYRPGDILNPDDVSWERTNEGCSECCDNCMPDGLKYRCPILRGTPICAAVELARVAPPMTEEDHKAEIRELKRSQIRVRIARLKCQLGEAEAELRRLDQKES